MRNGARPPRPPQFDFVFESGLSPRAGLSNGSVDLNGGATCRINKIADYCSGFLGWLS